MGSLSGLPEATYSNNMEKNNNISDSDAIEALTFELIITNDTLPVSVLSDIGKDPHDQRVSYGLFGCKPLVNIGRIG